MGWTLLPVSIGDDIKAAQIAEVCAAIIERQEVVGGSPPAAVGAGDTLLASVINTYRAKIEGLLPYFIDETTGNTWTKAALFEGLYGAGRTDWLRRPARDPAGELQGALQSGDICYTEQLNEMRDVLNQLEWLEEDKIYALGYYDTNGKTQIRKQGLSGYESSRGNAVDAFWSDLQATETTTRSNLYHLFYGGYYFSTYWDGYRIGGELGNRFYYFAIPDGAVVEARIMMSITSHFADGAPEEKRAFNPYFFKFFGSVTSPGVLGEGSWAFGEEVASLEIETVLDEAVKTTEFDHTVLEPGSNFYLRVQPKNTRPDGVKTAEWLEATLYFKSDLAPPGVLYLLLKRSFEYV